MSKGYLFISNGRYLAKELEESLEPVRLSSFKESSVYAANVMGWNLYVGVNRTFADKLVCDDYPVTFYNQHIYRRVFDFTNNWIAYRNLCHFLDSHPDIDIVHCNTPIGGLLGRICGKKYHKKVIYTVHGFHFYKGAPLVNIIVFKLAEKWLARYTDAIITMNQEDYSVAKTFHLKHGGRVYYVPGVGIDTHSFENLLTDRKEKRKTLGVPADAMLGIIVGDLNENKNVVTLIKALAKTPTKVHYIICGTGPSESSLRSMSTELGVQDRCHFLGFRNDVKELYQTSDFFLLASKREGLSRSIMEAMCAKLPCIVSNIRGNSDLIDNKGGFLVNVKDSDGYAQAICQLVDNKAMIEEFGNYNRNKIRQYDIDNVKGIMVSIFKDFIECNNE